MRCNAHPLHMFAACRILSTQACDEAAAAMMHTATPIAFVLFACHGFLILACNNIASKSKNVLNHYIANADWSHHCCVSNNLHASKELVLRDADIASDRNQRLIAILQFDGGSENPFRKNKLICCKQLTALAGESCNTLYDSTLAFYLDLATPRTHSARDDFFHLFILLNVDDERFTIREAFCIDGNFLHFTRIHLEFFSHDKVSVSDGGYNHH